MEVEKKCKNCKFYTAPVGSEGRWMVCGKINVVDAYSDYKKVPIDGVGYADPSWERDTAELYVGPEFGCIHFTNVL